MLALGGGGSSNDGTIRSPSSWANPPATPDGRSAGTNARIVGVAGDPVVGPARTVLALCVARDTASVPLLVTGDPDTVRSAPGTVSPTLVTVPDPAAETNVPGVPATVQTYHFPSASESEASPTRWAPVTGAPLL